ncbi:MAG: metallophosphoesterase family protein [Gammaproteobacteria bacterium]
MRLLQLTDPHLSSLEDVSPWRLAGKRQLGYLSWARRRRHEHRREALDALTRAALAEAPDLVVVTGDLVHIGLAHEQDAAAAWLEQLSAAVPVMLVPGNHDVYRADAVERMFRRWSRWLGAESDAAFPVVCRRDELAVIALSSARPEPFWSAGGEIGAAQLARLEAALADNRDRLRCVLLHHPPAPGRCAMRKALRDAPRLAALLEASGAELVLHGHLHTALEYCLGERTRVFATPSASCITASGRAAYRLFDVEPTAGGYTVSAELKTLNAAQDGTDGGPRESWTLSRLP